MADTNTAIAQGIANLTKTFAPPSGQEYYAFQRAGQLRDEQSRLRTGRAEILRIYGPEAAAVFDAAGAPGLGLHPKLDLHRRSIQPGVDPASLDPVAYAVHGNARNTFKGQREDIAGQNARSASDRAGRLDVALVQPQGMNTTRVLPPAIAKQYGMPQVNTGMLEFDEGKNYRVPGAMPGEFSTVSGPPKQLTFDQVRGVLAQGAPPADQRRLLMQGVPTDDVTGPDGKGRVMYRSDAADGGAVPFDKARAASMKPGVAVLPDGTRIPAVFDPQIGRAFTTDGKPLPPEAQFAPVNIQTADPGTLGSPVVIDVQRKAFDLTLLKATSDRLRALVTANPGSQGLVGNIRGTVQDVIAAGGEVGQLFNQNIQSLAADAQAGRIAPEIMQRFSRDGKSFDTSIPAIQMVEYMLAAQLAKALDPNGRVTNQGMQQALQIVGAGGSLGNAQRTLAGLDELDKIVASQMQVVGRGSPAGAQRFMPDGVQPAPAPAPTPAPSAPSVTVPMPGAGAPALPPLPRPGMRVVQ